MFGRTLSLGMLIVGLSACPADEKAAGLAASSAVAASAASTSATPAATTGAEADGQLRPNKPKAHASTDAAKLGTLPEGVGLAVGTVAPKFSLTTHDDKQVSLDDLVSSGEALLVFYRGGW